MIKINDCLECRECCSFEPFAGRKLTLQEMEEHFSFTEKLCDTFFNKTDTKYLIGMSCKQYNNGKCSIYGKDSFPFACAIYPFILSTDKNGKYKLLIDRNCPSWKKVMNDTDLVIETINKYKKMSGLDSFNEKDLKRMGYKLVTIVKQLTLEEN